MLFLRVEVIIKIIAKSYNKGEFTYNIVAQEYLKNTLFNYMEELICQ